MMALQDIIYGFAIVMLILAAGFLAAHFIEKGLE